jgi:2-dehydropantoate 2-reductase
VEEVVSVAQRKGLSVDLEENWAMVAKALDEHGSHKPSMLQDILSKRETEIDTIAGGAVAEAEALGMAVPTTAVLADLVRTIQHEYLK